MEFGTFCQARQETCDLPKHVSRSKMGIGIKVLLACDKASIAQRPSMSYI